MEVYDLRSQRLRPKEFEKIVSPVYARSDVGREFVVVRGVSNPFHSIDGLTLRHRFEFNPNAVFGNDSNLLIVFYVQIMPDDLVMQLHRF